MRRRDFLLPAASAALACCAKKPPQPLQTIRVGVANYASVSPLYLALERGYFRDAGFDAQLEPVVRIGDMVSLLASGHLDAALAFAAPPFLNAVARGANIRVVLGREVIKVSCGDLAMAYLRTKAFPKQPEDVRQWVGKKIWCGQGATLGEFFLDTALTRAGLKPEQTIRPVLNQNQAVAALRAGAIDGMVNLTNIAFDFSSHPEIILVDTVRKLFIGLQTSYILFGGSLLKGDVAAGGRFLSAFLRGTREFAAGATPQYLRDLVAAQGKVVDECRDYFADNGALDMNSLRMQLDWAVGRGYVPASLTLDSLADHRFLPPSKAGQGGA